MHCIFFELMYSWIKGLESPEQVLIRFAQNQLNGGSMEMASSETSLKKRPSEDSGMLSCYYVAWDGYT